MVVLPGPRPMYRPRRLSPLLCSLALLATAAPASSQSTPSLQVSTRPLQVEDLFRIASVRSPVASPDGRYVAYVVSTESLEENSSRSDIWMMDLAGDGEPRRMTAGEESAGSPAFSPDGRYLSFLSGRDDGAGRQVWTMPVDGGEARPLTHLDRGISDYAWAPDGRRLALALRDEAEEREEGEPRGPWVIDRRQFKQDYSGYLDRRRTHLYILDFDSRELTRLTSGDYDHGSLSWSPDGTRIAFVSNRTEEPDANYDTDVWIVDVADAGEAPTGGDPAGGDPADGAQGPPREVSPGAGSDGSPVWSPDGATLAWLTSLRPEIGGYAMSHLAVATPGQPPRILTEALDRNLASPRFTSDGDRVLGLLESEGSRSLVAIPLAGGDLEVVWGGPRRVEAFVSLPDGRIVAQASTADAPSELWLVDAPGSATPLTHHNGDLLAELELGAVRKEWVTAPDGTELEAFYTFPPGAPDSPGGSGAGGGNDRATPTEPLPTILWIHGGPMGQDSWGWHGLRQLFAAQGYLVVQPNYRGSHGYGQDFALGLWQDWGGPERIDAIASVDHAIQEGWADPDRLGVGGWSYGAITTNAIITHTDRFDAAVSGAGAALHVASWGHDQYQRWYTQELGYPWENQELWDRLSPFYRVDEITTPTLWMGGEHDWNVPILQSEIMYQSMKALDRETLLVVYPDQGHGGFPPAYEADRYRRFLGWFGRYLGGDDEMWPGEWPASLTR